MSEGYAENVMYERQKLSWNVVEEQTFRARVRNVFDMVAGILTNSLGPDGSNTVIEKFGEVHITKDGWNILKKIQFNDSVDNTILQLLVNIAAQVVIKVGDGSTSSIVAANELLKSIESVPELKRVRSKQLVDSLSKIANNISAEILARSNKIDISEQKGLDEIYRLALVSTNGEHSIADMIRTIYRETNNPSIDYIKSRTNRSHYEIIDGYQAPISFADNIYINNSEDGTCDITKPLILMFDHRIDKENHFDKIIAPVIQVAIQANRRLVVMAPRFEDTLLQYIQTSSNIEVRSRQTTQVVYARASLVTNLYQEFYSDFAIMTGAQIVRENDMIEAFRERKEEEEAFSLDPYIGEVDKIAIGSMTTSIHGFTQKNEGMYKAAVADALAKFRKVEASNAELNVPNPEIYDLKKRVAKLTGKMGVIHVGGNSSLEKVANFDLVEDAVRAAESAFNYGYNIGGNLIIPIVIKDLIAQSENETEKLIYNLFSQAFRSVFGLVIRNKYTDYTKDAIDEIVTESVENQMVYDLISDKYSADIINPSYTDIEITKAVTSIVALLMGANQFLSIQTNTEY